jgi:hypothetical protein
MEHYSLRNYRLAGAVTIRLAAFCLESTMPVLLASTAVNPSVALIVSQISQQRKL